MGHEWDAWHILREVVGRPCPLCGIIAYAIPETGCFDWQSGAFSAEYLVLRLLLMRSWLLIKWHLLPCPDVRWVQVLLPVTLPAANRIVRVPLSGYFRL